MVRGESLLYQRRGLLGVLGTQAVRVGKRVATTEGAGSGRLAGDAQLLASGPRSRRRKLQK